MAFVTKVKNVPKWKRQEFFNEPLPLDSTPVRINVDSQSPIDRIRITMAGISLRTEGKAPGILVYSNIVNNFIGTFQTNYIFTNVSDAIFMENLEVGEGMDFFYRNKVLLQGSYDVTFHNLDGTVYDPEIIDSVNILVEYFVDN